MKRGQILGILALLLVCAIMIIPAMAANETTPTDAATGYYNAAVQLLGGKDYSGAIVLFDKALASNTTMIQTTDALLYTYQGKSYAQIQLGNYSDAITTSDAGLAEYPNDDMLWNNKGYAQYNLGKYTDAVTSYNQALANNANYTGAMINKGDALVKLGNYQDAITSYKAALATDPGNSEATTKLAAAQKAAPSVPPVTLIVLALVVVIVAAGVAYYVTKKTPATAEPDKKTGTKKNKK
jgi:tetratricopeptide (TPR) repeat protein